MKKIKLLFYLFTLFAFCGCSNNTVAPPEKVSYKEIVSVNIPGNVNLKLYITDGDSLTTGYNDIYMKVWKNSDEQNSGFVKFFPKMWMTPYYMHSTAVSEKYYYDNSIGYYKGYAIFSMVTSPPEVVWYGVFTFVDGQGTTFQQQDSTPMYTTNHMEKQWRFFYDTTDQSIYMFSLVKPFKANRGLNDMTLLLHKTDAQLVNHLEIHDAVMSITVYDIHNFNQSTGNISPVPGSDGY
jgi:hypothetical protein